MRYKDEFCYQCGRRYLPKWYSLTSEGVEHSLKIDGTITVAVGCPEHNYGSWATLEPKDIELLGELAHMAELFLARHVPISKLRSAVKAAKGETEDRDYPGPSGKYDRVCPRCKRSLGLIELSQRQASHWQGAWCCGVRDVELVPVNGE